MPGRGIKKTYRAMLRAPINRRNRMRLCNTTPTIIANNCNGGVIYHDLGLCFSSPTVNLYFPFPDYIRFCKRMSHYLALPYEAMEEGPRASGGCPTGVLEDVHLVFVHYQTFDAARNKWFERAARVDMDNLFIILAQRDGCSADDVRAFGKLPFEHKVAFVNEPMPDVACAFYLPEFIEDGQVRVLTEYISPFSGRRIIDSFDYVGFLNGSNV